MASPGRWCCSVESSLQRVPGKCRFHLGTWSQTLRFRVERSSWSVGRQVRQGVERAVSKGLSLQRSQYHRKLCWSLCAATQRQCHTVPCTSMRMSRPLRFAQRRLGVGWKSVSHKLSKIIEEVVSEFEDELVKVVPELWWKEVGQYSRRGSVRRSLGDPGHQ